jgi:23S rRNA pseudouridine1911/1915/1917 synthase
MVKVNDRAEEKAHHLKAGDKVEVYIPPIEKLELVPERIPLNILYEDNDLIVLSKSAGLVVHPSAGHPMGTLVHALLAHTGSLSRVGGVERPGIIHRLDKDTSGLMIVAKSDFSHRRLSADLKARKIKRTYWALVHGHFKVGEEGEVDAAIGRHIVARKKMAVTEFAGRHAVTRYRVLESYDDLTLLEVKPETGRTHQIRVHMAYIKHPVVGDIIYGTNRKRDRELGIKRQLLHAMELTFVHPRVGKEMTFTDKIAPDFQKILTYLRRI